MEIKYIKRNGNDFTGYKVNPFKWCCDDLENNESIVLSTELSYGCDDNYTPKIMLHISDTYTEWGEECTNDFYYTLKFCPFCGKEIVLTYIGEEDISVEYKELSDLRDKLNDERRKTDSKKRTSELDSKIRQLDDKMQKLYEIVIE